jgi:hypothetical protein
MRFRPRPANVHRIGASAYQVRTAYESHTGVPMDCHHHDAARRLVKAMGFDGAKALIEGQATGIETTAK